MCWAWEEIKREAYVEGYEEGKRLGREKVRKERERRLREDELRYIIGLVPKKMLKGKTSEEIANDVEEDIFNVEKIKAAISKYKKMHENEEFDANKVLEYLELE